MTVIELIKELQKVPEDTEVSVSVYTPDDSGEQDCYEVDCIQYYPPSRSQAFVQIKTKS